MSNKNWQKHLKRKIHKNRWLIWAVAYILVVGLALVSYITVSEVDFERQVVPYKYDRAWQIYRDARLTFSLRFPPTWGIEAQQDAIIFEGPNWGEEVSVSVHKSIDERLIRKSLKIGKEEKITVDGRAGVRITNLLGQNAYENLVLVNYDGRLYVIRGSGFFFDQILSTFNFLDRKILESNE